MIVALIENWTKVLGAPAGWTPETGGECLGLPIREQMNGDVPAMISEWRLTTDEVAAIVAGAPLHLSVLGTAHPPVSISVAGQAGDVDHGAGVAMANAARLKLSPAGRARIAALIEFNADGGCEHRQFASDLQFLLEFHDGVHAAAGKAA
jgi:hypothetical protein